ncbi:MAG: metallophosphoesterase family protein [Eubacterium sp.]|nr:metallophosphoesterase family protein [Eubacterium sp.]
MRYYISDLHFYHEGMNERMDCRGFQSVEEMNEVMIDHWNRKVRKNDEVVILGDLSMGTAEQTNRLLERLQGKLYMIYGNHDHYINSHGFNQFRFKWIKPYAEMSDESRKVILCHYPVFCYNGQYRVDSEGGPKTYMLYGHVHNSHDEVLINRFINETRKTLVEVKGREGENPIPCNMINCFCMFSDYMPLTLDEWIETDRKRRETLTEADRQGLTGKFSGDNRGAGNSGEQETREES